MLSTIASIKRYSLYTNGSLVLPNIIYNTSSKYDVACALIERLVTDMNFHH